MISFHLEYPKMYGKISASVLWLVACVVVSTHLNTLIFLRTIFVTTVNKILHLFMFVIMLYYFVFISYWFVIYNDYSHGFVQFSFLRILFYIVNVGEILNQFLFLNQGTSQKYQTNQVSA